MANKAMWDWMDKAEGKKEGSSFAGMNKERERQGYKKESSPARSKALEKKKYPKYTRISNDKKQKVTEHIEMDAEHRKAYRNQHRSY